MTDINYKVVKSEKATKPRIDVDIKQTKVVIPKGSDIDPDKLVEDKKGWIQEKQEKFDKYKEQAPPRNFEEGEVFLYLGEEKKLKFGRVDSVSISGENLVVPEDKKEKVQEELRNFYQKEARKHIEPKVKNYKDKIGVHFNSLTFRNQRTLWGSCSSKENLSLNWRLVMAPEEVIDYVVAHELTHLRERNHTERFWEMVKELHPSVGDSIRWLNENSPKMIFKKEDL